MFKYILTVVVLFSCSGILAQTRMVTQFDYSTDENSIDKLHSSATYTYSNGRDGAIGKPINYDTCIVYATTDEGTVPQFRHIQHFNAQGLADVREQYAWNKSISSGGWMNWFKEAFFYDAQGNLRTDSTYAGTDNTTTPWVQWTAHSLTYNSPGQVSDSYMYVYYEQTATWDTQYHYHYTYDALGRRQDVIVRADSQKIMIDVSHTTYTYRGNTSMVAYTALEGLLIMGGWSKIYDIAYAYNTNNTLARQYKLAYHISQSIPDSESRITYYYDANNFLTQEEYSGYAQPTKSWVPYTFKTYTNNADGNRTSYRLQYWDDNVKQYVNEGAARYYYETFFPTDVAQLKQQGGTLQLYPVPASNTLNVTINWDVPQQYTLTIADMQGRVNMQYISKASTEAINVSMLPTGAYNLILKGNKGGVQHGRFNIVR